MLKKQKWTPELIKKEAKKYKSRGEFVKGSNKAYGAASRLGILDKVCSHMEAQLISWTSELIKKEALKYKTRKEFGKGSNGAYQAARKRGTLDKVCSHMPIHSSDSQCELELMQIIKKYHPKAKRYRNNKVRIKKYPKLKGFEIDILIPALKKGIEFDGNYWHGSGFKRPWTKCPDTYHKVKDGYFLSKGIEILHISENDWIEDKNKCIKACLEFLKNE